MNSALDNLCSPAGPLKTQTPDKKEIEGLRTSGFARLTDSLNSNLSLESRFDLAYNAGHALCLAALRQSGYRPRHRYIVFQLIPHTLSLGPEVWRILAKAHDKRNLAEYEGHVELEDRFVQDLIGAVQVIAEVLGCSDQLSSE